MTAFTFRTAPIFRFVFFIIRCVSHDGAALVLIRPSLSKGPLHVVQKLDHREAVVRTSLAGN